VIDEATVQLLRDMRSREAVRKYLAAFLTGDALLGESVVMTAPDGATLFEGVVTNPVVLGRRRALMAEGVPEAEVWNRILRVALYEGREALAEMIQYVQDGETVHAPRRSDG
jgi:uncharacterized protein YbjT (DUF2867 family)